MEISTGQIASQLPNSPLLSLAAAYGGGLLASLTPCVYPMIPITSGVIAHANVGGGKMRGALLSFVYVLGMALTYAALGVFAAATGSFFGQIGSSPWTFLVVGNLILLFALWMLDVFQLPSFFNTRTGALQGGFSGVFLAGISAAFIAGPCTTPILGALLAYTASSQNMLMGASLLFAFALGMGTLLMAVGFFSSFLAALPRSGAWMVGIKKAMGVLMLVMAEYFLVKAGTLFF